jgi:hypothetical protein
VLLASGQKLVAGVVSTKAILLTEGVLRAMWMTKLKIAVAALLAVAVVGVSAGALYLPEAAGQATTPTEGKSPASPKAGTGAAEPTAPASKPAGPEAKLAGVININFVEGIPVRDALEYLREKGGLNLVVDRSVVNGEENKLDRPVRLRLQGVPLRTALRYVMREAGLSYTIEDGILVVSATPDSERNLERRVYPVADLVPAGQQAENLIDVITGTVEPQTWARNSPDEPGAVSCGSIAYFVDGQCLVVNQTPPVQGQVEKLLTELRAARKAKPAPSK